MDPIDKTIEVFLDQVVEEERGVRGHYSRRTRAHGLERNGAFAGQRRQQYRRCAHARKGGSALESVGVSLTVEYR